MPPRHFIAILVFLIGLGHAAIAHAQSDFVFSQGRVTQPQSDLDLPLKDYLAAAGARAELIQPGDLKIDGHTMICGKRPTVIDPEFSSWGGAYPGYLILNPKRLEGLSTSVKLFIFSHECGHQFIGRDEGAADCFGIKRGRRYGWLDEQGLEEVCAFMSKLKGTSVHAAGPDRCEKMRQCFREAAPRASRQ